jgi:ABC-type amino acid transport substrate-binding protein
MAFGWVFGAVLLLGTAPGAGAESPAAGVVASAPATLRLRFAPEADYGPFVFQGPEGRIMGLSVDLLERLTATAGWQLEMLPARPLSENLAAARRGEVDLLSSLRPTPERAAYLAFSPPYVSIPAVLVRRRDAGGDQLSGYDGQPVAVGEGYAVQAHVREFYPHVQWQGVPDDARALELLRRGGVRAAVMDVASARFLMRQMGIDDLHVGAAIGFEYTLCFAWRRDRPDIGVALQRAMAALPLDERDAVTERWIGGQLQDMPDNGQRAMLKWGAGVMAVGLAGWWISALRRRRQRALRRRERSS